MTGDDKATETPTDFGQPAPATRPELQAQPPSVPAKSRSKLLPIVIALSVFGLVAAVFFAWIIVATEKEYAVYQGVEKSYQAKLDALVGEGSELSKDPSAYIMRNRERIVTARAEIAAAQKAVKTLEESTDRSDYLETLSEVDAQLAILAQFASAKAGPEELAVKIEKAARPMNDANTALAEASDAARAKKYDEMIANGKTAVAKAAVAEPLLAALDKEAPGIGLADLRDAASVVGEAGQAFVRLGEAYKAQNDPDTETAEVELDALSGKYQGAFKRATTSAAWALWASPGTALQDTFRALESAASAHAKVYQRIENGD